MIALSALLSAACTAQIDRPNPNDKEDTAQTFKKNELEDVALTSTDKPKSNEGDTEELPCVTQGRAYNAHNPLLLSAESSNKFKTYFYENITDEEAIDKWLLEGDEKIDGGVRYNNGSSINYYIHKIAPYGNDVFQFHGKYATTQNFSDFDKEIIYKMLDIVGVSSPTEFFQQLLDSPENEDYTACGCTIQEKKTEKLMIEISICEANNATILSIYNAN